MEGENCPPFPHHVWLAHWLTVQPPRVFDVHECRHVAHHLLLTTRGEADVRITARGTDLDYHSSIGGLGFFPCDHLVHAMSITTVGGFTAYELMVPDRQIRTVCLAEGLEPVTALHAIPDFRDSLLEACLLRLAARAAAHQVSEDIGDEIAARHIVLRLCAAVGGAAPDWARDASVFTPVVMRRLVASIDAHLDFPLSLEAMAGSVGLSPGHFARKFRHSAGVSVNRFLNTRRIAASLALLRTGGHPLSGIALDLGFSSQSHFTRLFSSLTGLSPQAFRRLHQRIVG